MISYKHFLALIKEETTAGDIGGTDSKVFKKVVKKKKPKESCKKNKEIKEAKLDENAQSPQDILRKENIKIKSIEMDDESYVILLYKTQDITKAKDVLEDNKYKVYVVGKLLYIS